MIDKYVAHMGPGLQCHVDYTKVHCPKPHGPKNFRALIMLRLLFCIKRRTESTRLRSTYGHIFLKGGNTGMGDKIGCSTCLFTW